MGCKILATGPAGEGGKDTGKYGFSATKHIVKSLPAGMDVVSCYNPVNQDCAGRHIKEEKKNKRAI